MNEAISAAIARKELPPMEPGAMCYMMSKEGYGGDSSPHWPSHLMFFFTDADLASWGANLPGSPVFGVNDPVEHPTQFVLTVPQWSDEPRLAKPPGIIISIYAPTGPLRTRSFRRRSGLVRPPVNRSLVDDEITDH